MLYKYFSGNNYSLDSLQKKKFWFSKPTEFNDPFDCNMEILDNYPSFIEKISKKSPDFKRSFQQAVKHFGICCFSEEKDNMHLWSLYANSYNGFALGFDESMFNEYFTKLFSSKCELLPAKYRNSLLDLDNGFIEEKRIEPDGTENGFIKKPIDSFLFNIKTFEPLLEYLICQKNEAIWAIEKEKRLVIAGSARESGAKRFEYQLGYSVPWPPNTLKEVILGHRMVKSEKIKIRDIINHIDPSISILQTSLNISEWKISVEPLNLEF